jgi:hypothetical protein
MVNPLAFDLDPHAMLLLFEKRTPSSLFGELRIANKTRDCNNASNTSQSHDQKIMSCQRIVKHCHAMNQDGEAHYQPTTTHTYGYVVRDVELIGQQRG